jgi:hypothetical protein
MTDKTPLEAPDFAKCNPVDALEWLANQVGLKINPYWAMRMREHCDQPVKVTGGYIPESSTRVPAIPYGGSVVKRGKP